MGFCKTNDFHEIFALIISVHRTEELLGQLCAPSSLSWRKPLSMRVFSLPPEALQQRLGAAGAMGCPLCHRAGMGLRLGYPRDREGWPDPSRARQEHIPHQS